MREWKEGGDKNFNSKTINLIRWRKKKRLKLCYQGQAYLNDKMEFPSKGM